jgi:uncharacterized protein
MSTAGDIAHAHHAIDYIEIAVTDIDAAKAFYVSAFGWSLVDYGPDYAGIQGDGKEVGGLRRDSEVAAGGKILKPIYAFPGGRRFHFADPAGNELAVWSDRSTTAA